MSAWENKLYILFQNFRIVWMSVNLGVNKTVTYTRCLRNTYQKFKSKQTLHTTSNTKVQIQSYLIIITVEN